MHNIDVYSDFPHTLVNFNVQRLTTDLHVSLVLVQMNASGLMTAIYIGTKEYDKVSEA